MFFFDVQQRGPWNGYAPIVQAHFQNGMAGSIFSRGVVVKFANGLHLFGSFESLGVVDNEEQVAVLFIEETRDHIQGNLLGYYRFIPYASPEEFTVICAMGTVPQRLDEFINSASMTDTYRQYHRPEIAVNVFGNLLFRGLEKTLPFSWDFADVSHTASLQISGCLHNAYRQTKLFLFDNNYHQNPSNRSV
jgi:hypothetical protein